MHGMNPDPCMSHALADRLNCRVCGIPPQIVKAEGTGPVVLTLKCHGETVQVHFTKEQLFRTQNVFGTPAAHELEDVAGLVQQTKRTRK